MFNQLGLIDTKNELTLQLCELFGKFKYKVLRRWLKNRFCSFTFRKRHWRWMRQRHAYFFQYVVLRRGITHFAAGAWLVTFGSYGGTPSLIPPSGCFSFVSS